MKRHKLITVLSLFTLLIPVFVSTTSSVVNADARYWNSASFCDINNLPDADTDDSSSSSSKPSGVTGDWLTPGTDAYKVAQKLFDAFTKDHGTSGAFATGVISDIYGESHLIPDIAEGMQRFGMNSKTPPAGMASWDQGGGGGMFQFTPYTKYTNSKYWKGRPGSDGWDPMNQVDAIWDMEIGNRAVEAFMTDAYTQGQFGRAVPFHSLDDWLSTDDPVKSNATSQMSLERGAKYDAQREDWARQADKVFNSKHVKADPSKWNLGGGSNTMSPKSGSSSSSDSQLSALDKLCLEIFGHPSHQSSDGTIVKTARKYLGWFHYVLSHGLDAFKSWDNPPHDAETDCSGFVWFILHKTGYSVPDSMGWTTGSMEQDAKGPHKYLKEISPSEAGPGDIVIVNTGDGTGAAGHTAILTEKWQSGQSDRNVSTKVIQQGGSEDKVNEAPFNTSFLSLLESTHTTTLAKPVKK